MKLCEPNVDSPVMRNKWCFREAETPKCGNYAKMSQIDDARRTRSTVCALLQVLNLKGKMLPN